MAKRALTDEQKAARAAYMREYRIRNPEMIKAHAKRSREKNKDSIRERQRKWADENKEHRRTKSQRHYLVNKDRQADLALRRRFGLSLLQYNDMLASQGGGCAICGTETSLKGGKPIRFSVDHDRSCCPGDHSCGTCVRGLLCNHCNVGVGHLRDNVELLQSAIEYLKRHHADEAQPEIEEPHPQ